MSELAIKCELGPEIPDMQRFSDIVVMPFRSLRKPPFFGDGGPLWPDFQAQTSCRHNRDGRPVDQSPTPPDTVPELEKGNFVWGGFIQPHFGHLITEHLTRLPVSLVHRPDDTYLFVIRPKTSVQDIPEYFYILCDWVGLKRSQIRVVTEPIRVESLFVAPQAEQRKQFSPPGYILGLYDQIATRNGLVPQASDLLYVSRQGLLARAKGGHAGEDYLVERLKAAGASILDPLIVPLDEQIAAYAGAKKLVFAEGSALHGRQLLGYRPQQISVLNRRTGGDIGAAAMKPRCDEIRYVDALDGELSFLKRGGSDELRSTSGLSTYNLDVLFKFFSDLGVDLSDGWDQTMYETALRRDIAAWLWQSKEKLGAKRFFKSAKAVEQELTRLGLDDLFNGFKIPSLQVFQDIVVVAGGSKKKSHLAYGGPIWPDFDSQVSCRFLRGGRPRDRLPKQPKRRIRNARGQYVWGGYVEKSFGHLVAEFLQRLPLSLAKRPKDKYLFIAQKSTELSDMPEYFFDLCEWYGLDRDRIEFVKKPIRVKTLRVAPQAEHLDGPPPAPFVLELLEKNVARNGLEPEPSDLLYVSRSGLVRSGKGGHVGEDYLVDRLRAIGVSILDPATAPLREQLSKYFGAKNIIFAEGSALHGRQLLGYVPQTITVFVRRDGLHLAEANLTPRCKKCRYVTVAPRVAQTMQLARNSRDFVPKTQSAISFYDTDVLFQELSGFGYDLASVWDPAEFREIVRADVAGWMSLHKWRPMQKETFERRKDYFGNLPEVFKEQGISDLLKPVNKKKAEVQP